MDISPDLIRAKRPCAAGYRWYLRSGRHDASYLELMQALVEDGRPGDAVWLLSQFGPTDDVLDVDELYDDTLVFPGTVRVRGNVDVTGTICVGGRLLAGGGVRCGGELHVREALECGGAVQAAGEIRCAALKAGMSVRAASLHCGGSLRVAASLELAGDLVVADQAHGGGGVTDDFGLAQMYKYARTLRIVDGPDEVHRDQLSRLEINKYRPPRNTPA